MTKKSIWSIILLTMMVIVLLFTASCNYDPDKAVNISDKITNMTYIDNDSTTFHFYFKSDDYSFDDYKVIKVNLDYYVDYHSTMKYTQKIINVPDDVVVDGEERYFIVEIDDVLTNESVVYTSITANYKSEEETSPWIYVVTVIIAVGLCAILSSTYFTMCQNFDSDSSASALMWLGGLIIYFIVACIIGASWGSIPCYIIIGSGVLYFLVTLIPYFMYK